MQEDMGHKIILQMTDQGLKALRLKTADIASALEHLQKGLQPSGVELEKVPEQVAPMADYLKKLGQGWMLVDAELESSDTIARSTNPIPEKMMDELKSILSAQPKLEQLPYEKLNRRIFDFLNDEKQLLKLMVEVQNSVGISLGAFFGDELLRRMNVRDGLCPVCWERKHCSSCSEVDDEAEEEPDEPDEQPSRRVPLERALDKSRKRSEEYTLMLHTKEPLWQLKPLRYALARHIKRMLFEIYEETGVQFPDIGIMRLSSQENLDSANLVEGEFLLTRRRRDAFRSKLSDDLSGPDRIEAFISTLKPALLKSVHRWLSISQISEAVEEVQEHHPGLWEEFSEVGGSMRDLRKLAQGILREGHSIRDLPTILECCIDHSEKENFKQILLETISTDSDTV